MDDDHEACHQSLKKLKQSLSVEEFRGFISLVQEHFDEEEKFFEKTQWGGYEEFRQGSKTVPVASHLEAHRGILAQLSAKLTALDAKEETLTSDYVTSVEKIFVDHTNVYDAMYAQECDCDALTSTSAYSCCRRRPQKSE